MRFAYADPPYLGQGQRLYGKHHDEAHVWDRPSTHLAMVETLLADYPDGFAISLHEPSLQDYLGWVPQDRRRVCIWFKTFAAFKPNVRVAYTWEPLIVVGGRKSSKDGAEPCTDVLREPITMQRGLPGAKPERFCSWVLDLLGYVPGDQVDDLFPGTDVMGRVVAARAGLALPGEFTLWEEPA